MECNRIATLLEKYFEGTSSVAEERELQEYFSSTDVAQHLVQYRPLFNYFVQEKKQQFCTEIPLETKKRTVAWLSIAASVVLLLGIGTFAYFNATTDQSKTDLGTYDDPEVAFAATQKALALLSNHVNVGIESVQYVEEFETSKNLIFKQ